MFRLLHLLRLHLFVSVAAAATTLFAQEPATAPVPQPTGDYLLQPQDLLRMQVFQEPDMLREVRISQEGTINLPLINEVDLRNKTLRQAEQIIRDRYDRDYLVNPQITLIVVEYAKRTVNVLGNVNTPGAIPFPQEGRLNLIDAITRAGGFNRLADRKRVRLTRTAGGKTETLEINTDQLMSNKGVSADKWDLKVGDTIYVPERVL